MFGAVNRSSVVAGLINLLSRVLHSCCRVCVSGCLVRCFEITHGALGNLEGAVSSKFPLVRYSKAPYWGDLPMLLHSHSLNRDLPSVRSPFEPQPTKRCEAVTLLAGCANSRPCVISLPILSANCRPLFHFTAINTDEAASMSTACRHAFAVSLLEDFLRSLL